MEMKVTWKYCLTSGRMTVKTNLTTNVCGDMERKKALFTVDGGEVTN